MENSKIKELEKALQLEKSKENKKFLDTIEKNYGLKKGDVVEFTFYTWVNDYDSELEWFKGEIYDFQESGGSIFVKIKGRHETVNIDRCKLFDLNNYELRHSAWDRELDLGDFIQLIVNKPKSTKGKIYEIHKIVKEKGYGIEYFYYNDYGHIESAYEGDFHVTTQKY